MPRRSLGPLALAIAVLGLAVAACGAAAPGKPLAIHNVSKLPVSKTSHVVVVVMENKEESDIIGSPHAPYANRLAKRYGLAKQSFGIRHPSLPNYLALTSGSTHGISSDCTHCSVDAPNIVDQLEAAGISWRGYFEDQPGHCFLGGASTGYAKKHNPFIYYDSVSGDPSRCRNLVGFGRLAKDLEHGTLPAYVWVTPNLCNDSHDCDIGAGDRFLRHTVPPLMHELGPRGFLLVTYDEGDSHQGCCDGIAAGGKIATIVAGPGVRRHARMHRPINHYGVLASIERSLGLAKLGEAANPINGRLGSLFKRQPRIR